MKTFVYFLWFIVSGVSYELLAQELPAPHARLQLLDKVTGHFQVIEIHHQEAILFGTLKIHLYRCHRSSAQEIPWSTAYIDVWEEDMYQIPRLVYSGWIFSSAPATIEHPVYDIRLLECLQCTTCCQETPSFKPGVPQLLIPIDENQNMVSDE